MKKLFRRIAGAAVLATMVLAISACGDKDGADADSSSSQSASSVVEEAGLSLEDIVGKYEAIAVEGETGITEEDLALMRESGLDLALEVRADGAAELNLFGDIMQVEVDMENMKMRLNDSEVPFTYEDGKLTLEQSTGDMVFVPAS